VSEKKTMSAFQAKLLKSIMNPYSRWQAKRFIASGGAKGGTLMGREICVVTMKGAKTGLTRHIPLMYVPNNGAGVMLVASLGGAPNHPIWYHNLVANPDIEVQVKGETRSLRARIATPEEKAAVWPTCVEHYPDYQVYQDRCERDIPVFLCEPRDG
jgi:deazaflavin-dependent oxidoreductase (nitroreductase family)